MLLACEGDGERTDCQLSTVNGVILAAAAFAAAAVVTDEVGVLGRYDLAFSSQDWRVFARGNCC